MCMSCISIILLFSIVSIQTYDLECPHRSQWTTKAHKYKQCPKGESYHCLYDKNLYRNVEECFEPDDLPPGFKSVKSGSRDAEECSNGSFAPLPSWSNASNECIYLKSECTEEGQVVYDSESTKTDATCQCDFKSGYKFMVEPEEKVWCRPWTEDCTCYIPKCPEGNILTSDYECKSSLDTSTAALGRNGISTQWQEGKNKKTQLNNDETITSVRERPVYTYVAVLVAVFCIIVVFIVVITYEPIKKYQAKHTMEQLNNMVKQFNMYKSVKDTLEKHGTVVLKGRSGTGKSTFGNCLKDEYKKQNYKIIHIKAGRKEDYLKNKARGSECFIYIENLPWWFMKDSVSKSAEGDLCEVVKKVLPIYMDRKKNHRIVVLVERQEDLSTIFNFDPKSFVIDFDNNDFYSTEEKVNILEEQIRQHRLILSDNISRRRDRIVNRTLFDSLVKENPYIGFPKMCSSFCEHEDHIKLGISFVKYPPESLVSKIDKLHKQGKTDVYKAHQYSMLVALMLEETCVSLDNLVGYLVDKHLKDLYNLDADSQIAKSSLEVLRSFYINADDPLQICFVHETVRQAVMLSHSKVKPFQVTEKCCIPDVLMFHRPRKYETLHGEVILAKNFSQDELFAERISKEMMGGKSRGKEIITALEHYTKRYSETELLRQVIENVNNLPMENQEIRLDFFHTFRKYAETFGNGHHILSLVWEYMRSKLSTEEQKLRNIEEPTLRNIEEQKLRNIEEQTSRNAKEETLKNISKKVFEHDFVAKFLKTRVDKHQNTLLHYFVIWNTNPERDMLSDILSLVSNSPCENVFNVLELKNSKNHSPMHFAAYLGRYDIFSTLKQIAEKTDGSQTRTSIINDYPKELSEIESLIVSGQKYERQEEKHSMELSVLFERGLVPNRQIVFGEKEQFMQMKKLLHIK